MRPIDMTKIGFLYLCGGQFKGRRILDCAWVDKSLSTHVRMPAKGGPVAYGYYWWLYPDAMSPKPGEEPGSELP
jgi:CubicO group peptidase (beta-lactamase class C family)